MKDYHESILEMQSELKDSRRKSAALFRKWQASQDKKDKKEYLFELSRGSLLLIDIKILKEFLEICENQCENLV